MRKTMLVPAILAAAMISSVVSGCAGSSSAIVRLQLTSAKADALNVMPFNTTFERKYYSDAGQRMSGGVLLGLIALEIDRRSSLYTYTFDVNDLANLRTTILDSLKAAGHFGAVIDIEDASRTPAGLRLSIDLESMGVSQKVRFICDIKARAKVTDQRGVLLAERNIVVSEKGTMTLSAAKNAAIETFVQEIGKLLNSI